MASDCLEGPVAPSRSPTNSPTFSRCDGSHNSMLETHRTHEFSKNRSNAPRAYYYYYYYYYYYHYYQILPLLLVLLRLRLLPLLPATTTNTTTTTTTTTTITSTAVPITTTARVFSRCHEQAVCRYTRARPTGALNVVLTLPCKTAS